MGKAISMFIRDFWKSPWILKYFNIHLSVSCVYKEAIQQCRTIIWRSYCSYTTHSTRSWKIWIWKVNAYIPTKHNRSADLCHYSWSPELGQCRFWKQWLSISKMHNPQSYDHNAISLDSASHKVHVPVVAGLRPWEKNTAHKIEDKMLVYEAENTVVLCM